MISSLAGVSLQSICRFSTSFVVPLRKQGRILSGEKSLGRVCVQLILTDCIEKVDNFIFLFYTFLDRGNQYI